MPRLTTSQRQAAIESARRGARAAREIDPNDRQILDFAHMGSDPDEQTRRRLMVNPLARDYARLTVARWEAGSGLVPHG